MTQILAIVGMAGSGKGTITDHLESLGYPKIYFGGMVYEEVARRGLDIVEHEKEVREDMRKIDGPAVMAMRAADKADEFIKNGAETVVFDGLYSWSEYLFLREKYQADLTVIAVFTPKAVRYKRAADRREGHRSYTEELIAKRDHEEIENIEKGGPIAIADYTLLNDGTPKELTNQIDQLLSDLGVSKANN